MIPLLVKCHEPSVYQWGVMIPQPVKCHDPSVCQWSVMFLLPVKCHDPSVYQWGVMISLPVKCHDPSVYQWSVMISLPVKCHDLSVYQWSTCHNPFYRWSEIIRLSASEVLSLCQSQNQKDIHTFPIYLLNSLTRLHSLLILPHAISQFTEAHGP